jgi:acetylornithine deacetylase/succinyl-diaminopimelate desuccinylase-like protein
VAEVLGDELHTQFPLLPGVEPTTYDGTELVLRRTWKPTLSVTGADGFPTIGNAGNVLRPMTAFKLSLRTPPTVDAAVAAAKVKEVLEKDPPYHAKISFKLDGSANGWNAPPLAPWLENSLAEASGTFFGKPACYMGEGGSIPFMAMLGKKFPRAQFLITGVLGPASNAHGPNEFLHIATAKRLSACVAQVLADHHEHFAAQGAASTSNKA